MAACTAGGLTAEGVSIDLATKSQKKKKKTGYAKLVNSGNLVYGGEGNIFSPGQ